MKVDISFSVRAAQRFQNLSLDVAPGIAKAFRQKAKILRSYPGAFDPAKHTHETRRGCLEALELDRSTPSVKENLQIQFREVVGAVIPTWQNLGTLCAEKIELGT